MKAKSPEIKERISVKATGHIYVPDETRNNVQLFILHCHSLIGGWQVKSNLYEPTLLINTDK